MAAEESVKFIQKQLAVSRSEMGVDDREGLMRIARTSMSSKILRGHGDFFAEMAVDAISSVKHEDPVSKKVKCSVGNVQVLKQQGAAAVESVFLKGFALNCTRKSQQMPRSVKNAKLALLDFDLKRFRAAMGVELRARTVQDIEDFDEYEQKQCKKLIDRLLSTGANVVLTTKGIDDLAEKYLSEAGVFAVARVDKKDMNKIAKMTGGKIVIAPLYDDTEDVNEALVLGTAEEVSQERLSDDELTYIRAGDNARVCSIVLRGANEVFLDEMERSLHDVLCVLRDVVQTEEVVPGGGCVEAALSVHLENLATTIESKEQLAIAAFAEALLVIPRQLSINAGKDATELVTKLLACHHMAQSMPGKKELRFTGLDLFEGDVRNNLTAGVLEPAMSKVKSLQIAATACNNILRIDDFFSFKQNNPQGGPM
jgi:T-complex protein 1 subunit alpha